MLSATDPADAVRPHPTGPGRLLWRLALVLALGVLTAVFVVTTVGIDGDSMAPTLHDGERALVPRYETWWVRTGLGTWSAGDVVYFRPPGATARTWIDRLTGGPFLIKRIAAVEGDTVALAHGQLFVNGVAVTEPYLTDERVARTSLPPRAVPAGHVFVLGDNRAPLASRDSRAFGAVPVAQVAGRAAWVVWPPLRRDDAGRWRWNVRRL